MYPRRPYCCLVALLLGTAFLLAGCDSRAAGPTARATATATTVPTALPTATLHPVHFPVPPNCTPVAPGAFPTGLYADAPDFALNIKFLPNGQHFHPPDTKGKTVDCYLVLQQHLLISDPVGTCSDTDAEYGDYTWSFDGKVLRLHMVQDHCFERQRFLIGGGTGVQWVKQAET